MSEVQTDPEVPEVPAVKYKENLKQKLSELGTKIREKFYGQNLSDAMKLCPDKFKTKFKAIIDEYQDKDVKEILSEIGISRRVCDDVNCHEYNYYSKDGVRREQHFEYGASEENNFHPVIVEFDNVKNIVIDIENMFDDDDDDDDTLVERVYVLILLNSYHHHSFNDDYFKIKKPKFFLLEKMCRAYVEIGKSRKEKDKNYEILIQKITGLEKTSGGAKRKSKKRSKKHRKTKRRRNTRR